MLLLLVPAATHPVLLVLLLEGAALAGAWLLGLLRSPAEVTAYALQAAPGLALMLASFALGGGAPDPLWFLAGLGVR